MKKRQFITVEGIVQGVGFRPFVYNLAVNLHLKGWVNNNSEGVFIDLEGTEEQLSSFLHDLKYNPPPLSRIENIKVEDKALENYTDFVIRESVRDKSKITLISPDIATCSDCLQDIKNPLNRRYMYPFTNCTNCGPRFSIIKSIPYDRDKTTMDKFKLCSSCYEEYTNPLNRRFHAQPNACDSCGPHLFVSDAAGCTLPSVELAEELKRQGGLIENIYNEADLLLSWCQQKLKSGAIFALKGLTGFNLVCDAGSDATVSLLRQRKKRPHKPFAVMMKNIETVRKYCHVTTEEEELLTGIRKPIVLLSLKKDVYLPPSIAPGQNTLGVMLPYTPLHELLMAEAPEVLIMTSANIHGLPLEYRNEDALINLKGLVDYFLLHDRDIHLPVDDSVTRVILGEERIIRRARGYAPEPLRVKGVRPILACGSNMKNTFCIAKEDFLLMSQHNGDLENVETFEHYKNNIEHFKNIFAFKPEYLAADLHPQYASTQFALDSDLPVIQVQHHHAHIVSCLVENSVSSRVIGLSFDGTGYGTDGRVWGGEFLICERKSFIRAGHLKYIPMPGMDRAVMEPWRMAAAYLYKAGVLSSAEISEHFGRDALTVINMIEKDINCIYTSSMGRLFDAVSAILCLCRTASYEGQASMELEALIENNTNCGCYPYQLKDKDGMFILDVDSAVKEIWLDKAKDVDLALISKKFHNMIIDASLGICLKLREIHGIKEAALSGGVFQNAYLLNNMVQALEDEGFKVYTHSKIPSNDGGISLGQIAAANETIKELEDKK